MTISTARTAAGNRHIARDPGTPCSRPNDFTAEIQRRLNGRGRHMAIEINPLLAQRLRDRYPGTEVIQHDAAHHAGVARVRRS